MIDAKRNHRNLLTEKYLIMMKSTDPDYYYQNESMLIPLSNERINQQEEIISIEIEWAEAYCIKDPRTSRNNRVIHTYEDTIYHTSIETYLRGEISTYSNETFDLYRDMVVRMKKDNENLFIKNMDITAKLYGYKNLDDVEKKMPI